MRWAGHVAYVGEKRNSYGILVGNSERKRPLGRHTRRWVDATKRVLKKEDGWYEQYSSGSG
jgi:hypothetical protein